MFKLKNKSTVALNAKTVHEVREHGAIFILPNATMAQLTTTYFNLRYVSSNNLVSHEYHEINIQH
jgi:hypothetical protein